MSSQPTRLNVFKNDQDTWDYTNPNLGGPGKSSSRGSPDTHHRFLHSLHLTINPLASAIVGTLGNQASGAISTRLDMTKTYNIKPPFLLIRRVFEVPLKVALLG